MSALAIGRESIVSVIVEYLRLHWLATWDASVLVGIPRAHQ